MKLEKPANSNYACSVIQLSSFVELENCQHVKAALLYGNSVIVSKTAQAGELGLFFPVETAISKEFLGANNQFRKPEMGNTDPEKKGFFEEQGRVKAMKFRGHKSEGFWVPIEYLSYTGLDLSEFKPGMEFDAIGDRKICEKYIPRRNKVQGPGGKHQGRQDRAEDRIVEGQFRFHIDTDNLRRNVHQIQPDMWISISSKWHGTSAIFANLLVKRELNWLERLLKRCGVKVQDHEYGYIWSSRRVVKGVGGQEKANSIHYYDTDIWGIVAKEIADRVPLGYAIYAEIVGFTPEGSPIQGGYHYGCERGSHRTLVYRVTVTNPDGKIIELSWQQMKEFCARNGLEMVKELWYGQARNFGGDGLWRLAAVDVQAWQVEFLKTLETMYVRDEMCEYNNMDVPREGVVIKVDWLDEAVAFKCKQWNFLLRESAQNDLGVVDIETEQSEVPSDGEVEALETVDEKRGAFHHMHKPHGESGDEKAVDFANRR